jgi:hypothetical protein
VEWKVGRKDGSSIFIFSVTISKRHDNNMKLVEEDAGGQTEKPKDKNFYKNLQMAHEEGG